MQSAHRGRARVRRLRERAFRRCPASISKRERVRLIDLNIAHKTRPAMPLTRRRGKRARERESGAEGGPTGGEKKEPRTLRAEKYIATICSVCVSESYWGKLVLRSIGGKCEVQQKNPLIYIVQCWCEDFCLMPRSRPLPKDALSESFALTFIALSSTNLYNIRILYNCN